MVSIQQRNKDFYTEEGLSSLVARAKSFIGLYNKNEFPFTSMMFGFGNFTIESREECLARIMELCELTGFGCSMIKVESGNKSAEVLTY